MSDRITPDEAAQALAAIESSRMAMRAAIRAHRGHLYLWLWGGIWIAMGLLAQFRGIAGVRLFPWLCLAGVVASVAIGIFQGSQIRLPVDRRFLAVLFATLSFGIGWGITLGVPTDNPAAIFAFMGLLVAQSYVVAGIWFDRYLLWLGLAIAAAMLLGLLAFAQIFWIWVAVFGGGTLAGTGVYVRFFMR